MQQPFFTDAAMHETAEETIISRWWEAKARVELSSSMKVKDIRLICRFVPFQDPETPFRLLAARESFALENILASLGTTRKVKNERKKGETHQSDNEIRSLRLAEEVMRFLDTRNTSYSPEPAWNWEWEAPDDRTIATTISSQVSSVFCTVIFSDWIRIALGYQVESLPKLMSWIFTLRNRCRQCLMEKPHLRSHYERLEKELRSLHPWAHWLLTTSLYQFDAKQFLDSGELTPSNDSAELLHSLPFLFHPIRELFAKKDQGLAEMLQEIAILNSRFQYDMVRGSDWTRPLSSDFSFRKGLSQKDLAGFATSITEHDGAHFDRLCGADFRSFPSGRLDLIDERLLKLSDDVRSCVTADADMVEPIAELTVQLFSSRNFASATAVLAALESVKIHPERLVNFRELIRTIGNHWSYRFAYFTRPGLLCPTPHVRELKHTQQPQTVLAEILRFKRYLSSGNEMPMSEIPSAKNEVIPKFQNSNVMCLVCRRTRSAYGGLRLKCEGCYRHERIRRRLSIADTKVRRHEERALEDDKYPAKRVRVASPNLHQDIEASSSQIFQAIVPGRGNSTSLTRPTVSQLRVNTVAQCTAPPTPPGTPTQQATFFLPHIGEFEAGLSRLRASVLHKQPDQHLSPPPSNPCRCPDWKLPVSTASKTESCSRAVDENSVGKYGSFCRPLLPPPHVQPRVFTSDPSLGEMFAEAAKAAGRRFYSTSQAETMKTAMPSPEKFASEVSSARRYNIPPPKQQTESGRNDVPLAFEEGNPEGDPKYFPPRNEVSWSRAFEPSAPHISTTTAPDRGTFRHVALHDERPEVYLCRSPEQIQRVEFCARAPPNSEMVTVFKPIHRLYPANSASPEAAVQHLRPTESKRINLARSVPVQGHPASPSSKPPQGDTQDAFLAKGCPKRNPNTSNPFFGQLYPALLVQNRDPHTHNNTDVSVPEQVVHGHDGAQVTEVFSTAFSRDKGKGKLIESPPEVLRMPFIASMSQSLRESIRSTAQNAMELVNIHGPD